MNERYSQEDIVRLRKETLAIMRNRIAAECRIRVLEEEGELENMCQIGGEPRDAFMERHKQLWKLSELCTAYVRKELEAVRKYANACWTYQLGMDKPS